MVSAAGAVDEDDLLELAERDFGAAAAPARRQRRSPPPSPAVGGPVAKTLEQANLVLLLPAVGVRDPDYFALRLLAEILGGGMASRLFQEAREKRGLAYAIDAYSETYADAGVLGVFAGCAAKDAAELARVAAGEIAGMAEPVGDGELARAKAQLKGAMFMGREGALARAEQAAGQVLLFGRTLDPLEIAAEVDAVTAGDIAPPDRAHPARPEKSAVAVLGPQDLPEGRRGVSRRRCSRSRNGDPRPPQSRPSSPASRTTGRRVAALDRRQAIRDLIAHGPAGLDRAGERPAG